MLAGCAKMKKYFLITRREVLRFEKWGIFYKTGLESTKNYRLENPRAYKIVKGDGSFNHNGSLFLFLYKEWHFKYT